MGKPWRANQGRTPGCRLLLRNRVQDNESMTAQRDSMKHDNSLVVKSQDSNQEETSRNSKKSRQFSRQYESRPPEYSRASFAIYYHDMRCPEVQNTTL